MASHQAGRGRDERAGAEDFESGLDYGAFVEDDAADDPNRTQALPAMGRDDDGGAQHTSALSPEDLAALRRALDIPVAADESVRRAEDPLRVARQQRVTRASHLFA